MFYQGKNILLKVNDQEIISTEAQLTYEARVSPYLEVDQDQALSVAPENTIQGSLSFSYYFTGEDPVKNLLSLNNGIKFDFGGLVQTGYIKSHSVRMAPHNPIACNAEIIFFRSPLGIFTPSYNNESNTAPIVHLDSLSISNFNNQFITGNYLSANLTYSTDITPEIVVGEYQERRGVFGIKETTLNIVLDNLNPVLEISGQKAGVIFGVSPLGSNSPSEAYGVTGFLIKKSIGAKIDDLLTNEITIKQYSLFPEPKITGFVPTSGTHGDRVDILGEGLGFVANVFFGEYQADRFRIINDRRIRTNVPRIYKKFDNEIKVLGVGGLGVSSGLFKYIPPMPEINRTSSITGNMGDLINIFGRNLDYVDNLLFAEQDINFNLDRRNRISFLVPENPDTGLLRISSNLFNIQPNNTLNFYPIFTIENFTPKNGPDNSVISISGKVLTSIKTGYIYINPFLDDKDYILTEGTGIYSLGSQRAISANDIAFITNINKDRGYNAFTLVDVGIQNEISGRPFLVQYKNSILNKTADNHIFLFPKISNNYMKVDRFTKSFESSGYDIATISLPTSFSDTGYAVFTTLVFNHTGDGTYSPRNTYIETKTTGNFTINVWEEIYSSGYIDYLAIKYGTGYYDSGYYECGKKRIFSKQLDWEIPFQKRYEYPPFLMVGIESLYTGMPITEQEIDEAYSGMLWYFYQSNIYNLTETGFNINFPSGAITGELYDIENNFLGTRIFTGSFIVNYLAIENPSANLSTFEYDGRNSYYKQYEIVSGNEDSINTKIALENIQKINKNQINFSLPKTPYHIDGKIQLLNNLNISKTSNDSFIETPLATGVFPNSAYKGDTILISGLSFKKPILNDGQGFNAVNVKFRYLENLYPGKINGFDINCRLLDVNTLSGKLPIGSLSSGRYAIQMITERGDVIEE